MGIPRRLDIFLPEKVVMYYMSILFSFEDINLLTLKYLYKTALAAHYYNLDLRYDLTEDDVIIGNGVSGCLDLIFHALLDEGDNILIPCPTYPLYQVWTKLKHYANKS